MQVQYSLIDRRPYSSGLTQYCMKQGISVLAYGVLAGGFLTDEWLNKPLPSMEVCVLMSHSCMVLVIKSLLLVSR